MRKVGFVLVAAALMLPAASCSERRPAASSNSSAGSAGVSERDAGLNRGKYLFQQNCASCHNPVKDATGPALQGILAGRDTGFLYRFLARRTETGRDSLIRRRIREYGMECMSFPDLSHDQVHDLELYFRTNVLSCRF